MALRRKATKARAADGASLVRQPGREQAVAAALPGFTEVTVVWTDGPCTAYSGREPRSGRLITAVVVDLAPLPRGWTDKLRADLEAVEDLRGNPGIAAPYEVLADDGRVVILADTRPLYWPEWSGWRATGESAAPIRTRPLREVLTVAADLAGALADAHAKGLEHRDLRPGTIFAGPEGKPCLGAFAVSTVRGSGPVAAALASHCPWHIAPETLETGAAGPPADVYGLGSTIYQVLAGRPPFPVYDDESRAALIVRILRDPITPLPGAYANPELQRLLAEMMAKDPARRPSARDAQHRFAALLAQSRDAAPMVAQKRRSLLPPVPLTTEPVPPAPRSGSGGRRPGPGPSWPTVVPPDAAERHVIVPPSEGRGQPSNPLEFPAPPLEPLRREGEPPQPPDAPVYVDPPSANPSPPARSSFAGGGRSERAPSESSRSGPGRLGSLGPWTATAIVAAVAVVVVAVLLLAGVI